MTGFLRGWLLKLLDPTLGDKSSVRQSYQAELEEIILDWTNELKALNDRLKREIEERALLERGQSRMQERLYALWKMARMVDTDFKTLSDHILSEILSMTESKYAFIGSVKENERFLTILSWSPGVMADCEMKNKHFSFPVSDLGLIGEAVRTRRPLIVNRYGTADHPAKKCLPAGHISLSNLMVVPVFLKGRITFLIAVANKAGDYTDEDLDQVDGFASNVQIVLERQKTEDTLKRSEERYRELVEGSSDLIIRTDRYGRFLFINHMAEHFYGLPAGELMGLSATSLIHPDDQEKAVAELSRAIGEGATALILENRLKSRTGKVYELYWTISLHYDEALKYTGSSAIGRDMTQRKKVEENLIKMKKLEAMGLLAGGIAHDFNNLLFVMTGNIELIKTITKPDGKTLLFLEQAEQAAFRAIDLTRKFITFSSGGHPLKSPLSINPVLFDVKDLVLSGSNISCETFFSDQPILILADKGQIRQVFSTVIDNAKQAMPDGGRLIIRSVITDSGQEKSLSGIEMAKGGYVKITLSDTGQGIKPDHLEKVFDPYFTTRESGSKKGLGLGLSIVHSIIKKHGGYIHIDSRWGEGTTVSIFLPVLEVAAETEPVVPKRVGGTSRKLLLMDDEAQIRSMSREILEGLGYMVATAADGDEAVASYRSALVRETPFDVVLLDLTIKGGMGGLETMKQLTEIDPGVKAIILSGYASDPVMSDYGAHGFKAALIKPVRIPLLHETIEQVLGLITK